MKHSQLVVNLPPDDVMRRLAASIDQPNVSLINPFAGKDFYGRLNGYQFSLRNRRRWSRNSLAPLCRGNVIPNGSGSTIDFSIGAKYTFLWILGGIFLLLSLLVRSLFRHGKFCYDSGRFPERNSIAASGYYHAALCHCFFRRILPHQQADGQERRTEFKLLSAEPVSRRDRAAGAICSADAATH